MPTASTVVAVIVIVVVLIAVGVIPLPAGAVTKVPTYATAQGPANSAASGVRGGPWGDVLAGGLALTAGTSVAVEELEAAYASIGCNVSYPAGSPSSIYIPPTDANATAGGAAAWIFEYTNATGLLLVAVLNGSATPLFAAHGGYCSLVALEPPLAHYGSLVDSSVAVRAVDAVGGAQFLENYTQTQRIWYLSGDPVTDQATWAVTYTTCAVTSTGSTTGYFFNATVDASTGDVITHSTTNSSCSVSGVVPESAPPSPSMVASSRGLVVRSA